MTLAARQEVLAALGATKESDAASRLDATCIVVDTNIEHAPLALSLVNLLARLVPDTQLMCGDDRELLVPPFGAGALEQLASAVVMAVRPRVPTDSTRTLRIAVGVREHPADLYVSASPWSLRLSRTAHPTLAGHGPASTAASAICAAAALREVCPQLPGERLGSSPIEWNLLDFRTEVAAEEPPLRPVSAVVFGAGSVGSSLVYALLLARGAGQLTMVDPDRLTPRNLPRYPALFDVASEAKVLWLARMATGTPLVVRGIPQSAAQFVALAEPIPLAVSAVDTADARRDIADALARQTLNIGVRADQFHVSRHGFGDGYACVYCGYLDVGAAKDAAQVYADMTGLPVSRAAVLLEGDVLSAVDVDSLVARGVLLRNEATNFEGARLVDVVRDRLYAQVLPVGQVEPMPAAYVSALAGAVAAAELLKGDRAESWLNRRVDVDCSGFPTGFQTRPRQDQTGRCLCHSQFRLDAYNALWR